MRALCGAMAVGIVLIGGTAVTRGQSASPARTGRGSSAEAPLPPGQRIHARDGDLVVIEDDARVRILRQRHADVRTLYNQKEQWFLLLADYVSAGGAPDGKVDMSYHFTRLTGEWPFDARWEGRVLLEDYQTASPSTGSVGLGIALPSGLVQFFGMTGPTVDLFRQPSVTHVLRYVAGGRGGNNVESFDQAEQRQLGSIRREIQMNANRQQVPGGVISELTFQTSSADRPMTATVELSSGPIAGQAPVRVGGNISIPVKLHDVRPVAPPAALQAGIGGVVILEIIIGVEGNVTGAKVLRGPHPMLEQPAIDAVKQWRFEPTLLNGRPVPVIMTATVSFAR